MVEPRGVSFKDLNCSGGMAADTYVSLARQQQSEQTVTVILGLIGT